EYAFDIILKSIPEKGTMMELGSYWAFYSMWFAREVRQAQCFMIEPDPHKMNFGKLNFRRNNLKGIFDLGFISDSHKPASIPYYSVDHLIKKHGIQHLNILHSDIQGFELKMLEGCEDALSSGKIDYFFISTHSHSLHNACMSKLKSHAYEIL